MAMSNTNPWPSSGSVGIGTATPLDTLHVVGNLRIDTPPDGQSIRLLGRSTDSFSQFAFYTNSGAAFTGLLQFHGDGTIAFVNTATLIERMRIQPSGTVGIGITPTGFARLDVDGYISSVNATAPYLQLYATAGATGQKFWRMGISGGNLVFEQVNDSYTTPTERMRVDHSGNVGIGTNAPIRILQLTTVDGAEFILEGANGQANYRKWNFYVGGASGQPKALFLRILKDDGSASTIDVMAWAPDGKTGIGTNSPDAKLHVAGDTHVEGGQRVKVTAHTSGSLTLDASHYAVVANSSGALTVNLPAAASHSGRTYIIKNKGTGLTLIAGTIDGGGSGLTLAKNESATLLSDGAGWFII